LIVKMGWQFWWRPLSHVCKITVRYARPRKIVRSDYILDNFILYGTKHMIE
jgi:hypothetical protein